MRIEPIPGGLRALAPAKLNLYLEIGPKRADGFHDIDSIFQSVSLFDELELRHAPAGELSLAEDGIAAKEKNLVLRAARALLSSELVPEGKRPGASIRLTKRIPEGGGLGGGSSDAAATLVALSRLWGLRPSREDLMRLGAQLGSDVPFFMVGGTARCRGRGEQVESLPPVFDSGQAFSYVLAYPRTKVPTKFAYDLLDAARESGGALTASSALDSMPPATISSQLAGGNLFFNRFEAVIYPAFPELRRLHESMCREPFLKVLLTGSGSTVYGVSRDVEAARGLAAKLRDRLDADLFAVSNEGSRSPGY